jgi:hypothetical protein
MIEYPKIEFYLLRTIAMVICVLPPLISLAFISGIDLAWLKENSLNLVATSGTMATISLVFLFERISAQWSKLWMRFLALTSVFYFLFAAFFGLMFEISVANVVLLLSLFWFTFFGLACLMLIGLVFFFSRNEVLL